jgi:hypothetical protein
MNINVRIERLILDGVAITQDQRPLLQASIEVELARLLAADGLNPALLAGAAVPLVRGRGIPLAKDSNPTQLGLQIAQTVYGGIGHIPR